MTLSVAVQHRIAGFALDVAFQAPRGVTVRSTRQARPK